MVVGNTKKRGVGMINVKCNEGVFSASLSPSFYLITRLKHFHSNQMTLEGISTRGRKSVDSSACLINSLLFGVAIGGGSSSGSSGSLLVEDLKTKC